MKKITNINDYHKVLVDWDEVKQAVNEIDEDFLKFYGPTKTKKAGIRARTKVMKMIDTLYKVRKKLLKQRQDYESEY